MTNLRNRGRRVRQRGMALLNALVIVSIAAGVAARLLRDDVDAHSRFEMMARSDQARQYVLAGEWLGRKLLEADWNDSAIDHLAERWAEEDRVFPIESGWVGGRILDLQGRFNINALVGSDGALHRPAYDHLERLLDAAEAPPATAVAVAEWIVSEPVLLPGAQGDRPYLRASRPYQRPRAPMAGASELRLVAGMTDAAYRRLRPWVTALPGPTDINVNTAPAPVLKALAPGIGDTVVAELIESRTETPFTSATGFRERAAHRISPLAAQALEVAPLTVFSSWFLIAVEAQAGPGRARAVSVARRSAEDGSVSVLMRLETRP